MSSIIKFQLPPIKGTDVFPETIKTPPVVHASVDFLVDNENPVAPEVFEDRAKSVLAEHAGAIGQFVQSQRQNYGNGIVDYTKTSRSYPAFDVSYMNIQGRQEIVTLNMRVDVRRHGVVEEEERDELCVAVFHDGNQVSYAPMSELDNPTGNASRRILDQSNWGADILPTCQINQGIFSPLTGFATGIISSKDNYSVSSSMLSDEFLSLCAISSGEYPVMNSATSDRGDVTVWVSDATISFNVTGRIQSLAHWQLMANADGTNVTCFCIDSTGVRYSGLSLLFGARGFRGNAVSYVYPPPFPSREDVLNYNIVVPAVYYVNNVQTIFVTDAYKESRVYSSQVTTSIDISDAREVHRKGGSYPFTSYDSGVVNLGIGAYISESYFFYKETNFAPSVFGKQYVTVERHDRDQIKIDNLQWAYSVDYAAAFTRWPIEPTPPLPGPFEIATTTVEMFPPTPANYPLYATMQTQRSTYFENAPILVEFRQYMVQTPYMLHIVDINESIVSYPERMFAGWLHISSNERFMQGYEVDSQRYLFLNMQQITSLLGVPVESIQTVLFDIPRSKIEQFQ